MLQSPENYDLKNIKLFILSDSHYFAEGLTALLTASLPAENIFLFDTPEAFYHSEFFSTSTQQSFALVDRFFGKEERGTELSAKLEQKHIFHAFLTSEKQIQESLKAQQEKAFFITTIEKNDPRSIIENILMSLKTIIFLDHMKQLM